MGESIGILTIYCLEDKAMCYELPWHFLKICFSVGPFINDVTFLGWGAGLAKVTESDGKGGGR